MYTCSTTSSSTVGPPVVVWLIICAQYDCSQKKLPMSFSVHVSVQSSGTVVPEKTQLQCGPLWTPRERVTCQFQPNSLALSLFALAPSHTHSRGHKIALTHTSFSLHRSSSPSSSSTATSERELRPSIKKRREVGIPTIVSHSFDRNLRGSFHRFSTS